MKRQTMFEAVGGLPVMERVHKRFYDKVYAHPWLGQFFEEHSQEAIELLDEFHLVDFKYEKPLIVEKPEA